MNDKNSYWQGIMEIVKITNNCKILDSGTVQTFDEKSSMELKIDFNVNFKMVICLEFRTTDLKSRNLETKTEGNRITFICSNFDNSLGTGTTTPLSVAVVDGKNVFFSFWVYSVGEHTSRKIDYCVYQEQ